MGLKLNKMDEEIILEELEFASESKTDILNYVKSLSPNEYKKGIFTDIRRSCFSLGLIQYQQEFPTDEIIGNFELAGEAMVNELIYCSPESISENVWRLAEALEVVSCFSNQNVIQKLKDIDATNFINPPDKQLQPLSDYVLMLKKIVTGEEVEKAQLKDLLSLCEIDTAAKEVQKKYSRVVQALISISENNADELQKAINEVLDYHIEQAKRGDYKESVRGFISFTCLMLIKLARNAGIDIHIDSLYVPVNLLR